MKRTFIKSITGFALCAILTPVYSGEHWYFTYGVGLVRPEINSNATVNNNSGASSPFNKDIYTSSKSNSTAFLLEIGKYWDIPGIGLKTFSLGAQYQHFMPTDIGKNITQYSSPDFLNYHYSLDLEANILMMNGRVTLFSWKNFSPFINVGAGLSQLITSGYSETALRGVTARTSPDFKRNTNYYFAYQAGAGISWEFNQTFFASINYIYQPLSGIQTDNGDEAWSNRKLDFGNTYASSVFITFTNVFNS